MDYQIIVITQTIGRSFRSFLCETLNLQIIELNLHDAKQLVRSSNIIVAILVTTSGDQQQNVA